MATAIPIPIIYVYSEIERDKYRYVKHYILESVVNGESIFSNKIKIEKYGNKGHNKPDYCLKIRENGKCGRRITGLFETNVRLLYNGDYKPSQSLMLFHFHKEDRKLIIYFFKNFFPRNLKEVINSLGIS